MELEKVVRTIDQLEGWAGAFLGTCLAFGIVCVGALSLFAERMLAISGFTFGIFVLLGASILEGPFLWRLWGAVWRGEFPVGPAVARRQSSYGLVLRIPAALWWGSHFAAGIIGSVAAASMNNPPPAETIIAGIMMLGLSVAGNVFLAMALKALTNKDDLVARFWQHRLLLDALISGLAFVVAQTL